MTCSRADVAGLRAAVVLLGAALAGCMTVDVPTDPGTFSVDPSKVASLSGAQPLSLKNAYQREAKQSVNVGNNTWVFDLRQMTDTSIVMLQRALDKGGVKVVPEGDRAMMLRVRVTGVRVRAFPPVVQTNAQVMLDVRFGATTLSIPAENTSPAGAQRAYDGAILFALNRLLADEKFIAYVSRGAHFACLWKDTYVVGENVILGERIVKIDRLNSALGQCSNPGRPTAVEVLVIEGDDRKEVFSYCASANAQVGEKLKIGLYASSARTATVERVVGASPRCDDPQRNPTRVEARFDERPKPMGVES